MRASASPITPSPRSRRLPQRGLITATSPPCSTRRDIRVRSSSSRNSIAPLMFVLVEGVPDASPRACPMFSLTKSGDKLILRYEVSPLRRFVLVGAGLGGLFVGAHQTMTANTTTLAIVVPTVLALALLAYLWLSDLPVNVEFDCKLRRVT